ncbi:MAG: zinc ribbon domain-containing protein [Nitrosotalea sp.]
MTRFEDELKKNNFVCSKCTKCQHFVWPPSEFCNKCLGDTTWEHMSKNAKLIEISSKDGKNFCIAEFEGNIRVFGTISGSLRPNPGHGLVLERCSYDDTPKFVFSVE